MSDDHQTPETVSQRGFEHEVRTHFATRSEVQEMLKPLDTHLGYHEGMKITWAIVVPLLAAFMSVTAILIAALV